MITVAFAGLAYACFLSPRLRLVLFLVRIWLLYAWPLFTFPLLVRENLFAAPLWVFIFGIVNTPLLILNDEYCGRILYSDFPLVHFLSCVFGDMNMAINRPSSFAPFSTLPISETCSANFVSKSRPMDVCCISRPRNRTVTLTLSPDFKNLAA